jgi:thioredoxin-related protein
VNADEEEELTKSIGVRSFPTLIFYEDANNGTLFGGARTY